jgi:TRAP-type C4-dicarboxylate transport system permease small subunit
MLDFTSWILYLHCPILIPVFASFSKRIRKKWKLLLCGVLFQLLATVGIYIFTWYNKWTGKTDWLWGWYLYYPVNIGSALVYIILILYIFKITRMPPAMKA